MATKAIAETDVEQSGFVSNIARLQAGEGGSADSVAHIGESDDLSIILFSVGGSQFALPTLSVTEVVRVNEIVAIPRAPAFIEGVIEIRDEVIPVIDLAKKLGFPALSNGSNMIVVAIVGGKKTGFIVEQAKKVLSLTLSELQSLGSIVSGPEARYIHKTVNRDGQPIVILNIDTLLNEAELDSLAGVPA